eukprot:INCI11817.1.p1 GENE.INCI11817.1~~INCI11817.1.p1  ORF type:complete len:267 (-),score=20.77 INCI11817.1:63-863(-)
MASTSTRLPSAGKKGRHGARLLRIGPSAVNERASAHSTTLKLSPVRGFSVASSSARSPFSESASDAFPGAKRSPGSMYQGKAHFFLDKNADTSKGIAPSRSTYGKRATRPARGALPMSPMSAASLPRTLEASPGRDLFYEQPKNPLHTDSSPIVISSLCYSGNVQAYNARVAAETGPRVPLDKAPAASSREGTSRAGTTSVKALFKAYHKSEGEDSAIHRRAVVAQAKARSARRVQRLSKPPLRPSHRKSQSEAQHLQPALSSGIF